MLQYKENVVHSLSVIVFMGILALVFAGAMLFCGVKFSPKSDSELKKSTYECGMPVYSDEKTFFNPKFFVYALLFIVFDAEMMLLFPFALSFDVLHGFVFTQGVLFLLLMFLSLSYATQKNMLRFK